MQLKTETLPHYLSRVQVIQLTGLSDEQIDALMPDGYFPEPERVRGKIIAWHDHEIADLISDYPSGISSASNPAGGQ